MTVSSTSNRLTFAGDDATTSFATSPVIFYTTASLEVTVVDDTSLVETALVENTDYDVVGGAGAVGTVDTSNGSSPWGALLTGTTLTIRRVEPLTQLVDLVNNSITDAEVDEDIADKLVMIAQQHEEQFGRSLLLPVSSAFSGITLPTPATNQLLGWNAGATDLENKIAADISLALITPFVLTIVDDATAIAVRQTLILDKNGADIASSATVNLDNATGDMVDVTGTTTITAITLAEGVEKTVRFTGALTLTDGASLVLPAAGGNITTAAGDYAVFRGDASSVVRCVGYSKLSGVANVAAAASIESGTAMLFYQASAPTGWTGSDALTDHGLRVVAQTGAGGGATAGTVNFTTAFASKAVTGTTDAGGTAATGAGGTGATGATTISTSTMPAHTHTIGYVAGTAGSVSGTDDVNPTGTSGSTGSGGSHTHTGPSHTHTGPSHTHTFTGTAIDLAVKHATVIIATKD